MNKDEKYIKSMTDKGFVKSCVWIPEWATAIIQAVAEALRGTNGR